MKKPIAKRTGRTLIEAMEPRQLLSTTYYVSNTGSNTNAGTSPAAPWQTVAKVDAASFQPGDSILFQYGSQYRESLQASSSGTAAAPITYGAYGDSTLAHPLFIGSNVLDNSMFTLVTGTTYSMPYATTINWVYDNHQFMRETQDALTQANSTMASDPATNIAYVEANTGFFYYDSVTTTLYVNRGGTFDGQVMTAAVRQDAILADQENNLIFTNLDVTETADDGAGYGERVQSSTNVQIINSIASLTGKHAFGAIDANQFLGQNLTANQSEPDLGFGGASAFVSYSDSTQVGNTAQWINDTYNSTNNPYEAFVSHGDPGSIASILIQNMISLGGYGTGMFIESTDSTETVTIKGGELEGGSILLATDHSLVDGVLFATGTSSVTVSGSDDVVQNCVFNNITANIYAGQNGGFIDQGTGNIARFNTFYLQGGPALYVTSATTNTSIYGNIFDCTNPICLNFTGAGQFTSNYNVYSPGALFITGGIYSTAHLSLSQWQTMGDDANSVSADPGIVDAAGGNFQLSNSSIAIDLYTATPDASLFPITGDIAGNPRPNGGGYDAGAYEAQIPITGSVSVADTSLAAPLPGTTAPALFTLTLSSPQSTPTTVDYSTADGTAIAGVDYTATTGSVTIPAGATTVIVSIPVSPTLAANSSKTFQLNLTRATAGITLGTATATAAVSNANETSVSFNKKMAAIYTDASGKKVTLKLGGLGSGTALFVAGDADPVQVILTGTTLASSFSVVTIGGVTTIEDVLVQGPIGSITTTATLEGSLQITGSITKLTLGNLTAGASLMLEGTGRTTIKAGIASSATLTSTGPVVSLTAAAWGGSITAPSIGTLSVKGAFGGNLNLTAAGTGLTLAKLGSITAGTWAITGITGTVSAASVTGLTATLTGGLKTLSVPTAVTNSTLRSGASIKSITIGAAVDSTFFAGVDSSVVGLPTAAGDFTSNAAIGSFIVTAPKTFANAFSDSYVAAAGIITARVERVLTANNATPFGFAVKALGSFTDIETGKKTFTWNSHKSTSLLTFAGDFKVSVI